MDDRNGDISKSLGATGVSLGIVIGVPVWIVTNTFFDIGTKLGLSNGVAAGLIIGSICALALIKRWFGEHKIRVIPFGMGWGTLVGIGVGLLFAWSSGTSYLTAFSSGSIAGLISGILIGSILWISF